MGISIHLYLSDQTCRWLHEASQRTGRSVQDLAEAAVAEAALEFAKQHNLTGARPLGQRPLPLVAQEDHHARPEAKTRG